MLRLPPTVFAERRRRLLERMPERSALLLPTAALRLRNADTHFPYRPDSDFFYVTGFPEPESWALLKKGGEGPRFSLFVLPKDPEKEVWTGIRVGPEGAKLDFGADGAWPLEEWDKELGTLLEDVETLYFAFGRHPDVEPRLIALLNRTRSGRKAGLGPSSLVDPGGLLGEQRLRKSPEELALMREGSRITGEAHVLAMQRVRPGMHEYEIQALVDYTFRRHGAWGVAYPSIVGGGRNACVLHYVENGAELRDGDLMLIDAGAEVGGYATDVTRTTPVGRKYSPVQRELYELVLAVQEEAISAIKPGATLDGLHDGVVKSLTQGLVDLGLVEGPVEKAIEDKTFRRCYMHRTSHWLGMDVHDVGRYVLPTGSGRPLEPGMVLTVEPGIYVAPNDEKAPERFRGIGIRIEDDILVTETGHENLTAQIPKKIEDVEGLRGG
jgi:Xaa-Pro aminopeptidase